ncbi:MAG: S9 family peptidase, partial [Pseudomonadota bacterium]
PNKAFVASAHDGETAALYVYDIATDSFEKELFRSEVSDVYGVAQRAEDGAALGVIFAENDADIHWFGDNFARHVLDQVKKALPGYSVTLKSLNANDTHSVIFAEKGNSPGQYYMYDHDAGSLVALPPQYPSLEGMKMGQTFVTSYAARDGLEIPAYITLPPSYSSLEEAEDLPFIVLPHGGPNARTFTGFDWEVQFLVSRGYGVLEMNFRGSSGYGQGFREAGDREWGQAMQDDITDGTKWLIDQGFAATNRIAIMGHSYGGYAALMGVVKTPDLYQCAVTHGAVTDLPRLIRHETQFVGGKYWTRRIGRLWGDREMLRENSPALRAAEIKVPVLLFHGEEDRVVIVDQTERMVSGLKRQGKEHIYVELPKGSHYLNVGNNRLIFLKKTEAFLGECLAN